MIPLMDDVPSRRPPVATVGLILANALVFALELSLPRDSLEGFLELFGIVPARFTHPAWAEAVGFPIDSYWPFLSSMFLHGGWLHIVGNMWSLWLFGDNVEDRMGHGRFLVFYLLCGIVSGIAHTFANPTSTAPALGASGAIAGVFGAYFLLFPHARLVMMFPVIFYPVFFEVPAFFYLGFWFLTQLFSSVASLSVRQAGTEAGGIAWWAHVGGFGAGIVLFGLFLDRRRRPLAPDEGELEQAWMRRHAR
jgi:membrane associated rhomboid family serine protease